VRPITDNVTVRWEIEQALLALAAGTADARLRCSRRAAALIGAMFKHPHQIALASMSDNRRLVLELTDRAIDPACCAKSARC